jgi:hypothetical protein
MHGQTQIKNKICILNFLHIFKKKYPDTKISWKSVSGNLVVPLGKTDGGKDGQTNRWKKGREEADAAATIRQQTGIFEWTRQYLLRRYCLCIEVGGRTFEHLLEIGKKYIFFFRILQYFCLISNLSQPQFDGS